MARPKTYHVDPSELLRAIHGLTIIRHQELDDEIRRLQAEHDPDNFSHVQQLHQERLRCDWLVYQASSLVDGPVDDGRRRAITRVVLELERDGFIRGDGKRLSHVQLTDTGLQRVQEAIGKVVPHVAEA